MRNLISTLLFTICIWSCNQSPKTVDNTSTQNSKDTSYEVKTGSCKLIQVDGKYNIWTKKIGDGKIKVLLLHGDQILPMTILNALRIFYQKKELSFTTTTNWVLAILIFQQILLFGIFHAM